MSAKLAPSATCGQPLIKSVASAVGERLIASTSFMSAW